MPTPVSLLLVLCALLPALAWRLGAAALWWTHLGGYAVAAGVALWMLHDDGELRPAVTPRPGDVSLAFAVSLSLFLGAYFFSTEVMAPTGLMRVCTAQGSWVGPPGASGVRAALEWLRDDNCIAWSRASGARGPMRAVLVLLIAALEEIAWRGGVQHRLADRLGSTRAWLAASLLYALAHLATGRVSLALLALPAGLAWGMLFKVRGSLVASVLSHAVFSYFFMVQRAPFVVR